MEDLNEKRGSRMGGDESFEMNQESVSENMDNMEKVVLEHGS